MNYLSDIHTQQTLKKFTNNLNSGGENDSPVGNDGC